MRQLIIPTISLLLYVNGYAQITPNQSVTPVVNDTTYIIVEQMPEFPGGQEAMYKFISDNIRYPQKEKDAGISGTVYISFVVDKDGFVTDIQELRGVQGGPGLSLEAIKVAKAFPKWNPGKQDKQPVNVKFFLPFAFKLPPSTFPEQKVNSDKIDKSDPKKYNNKEFGFSVVLPTNAESIVHSDSTTFSINKRIRLMSDTQKFSGLIKYSVTFRCIAEQFKPAKNVKMSGFNQKCMVGIIKMNEELFVTDKIKILDKTTTSESSITTIIYKLEYTSRPLIEYRKIAFKNDKSYCLSYLTRPEYFNEKEKDNFFDSLEIW